MNFIKCILLLVGAAFGSAVAAQSLQVGDAAPDFSLQASDGNTYTLGDYVGKQAVVLAWFPKAFTSGCTIECKSLAENGHLIREFDASYFMASTDSVEQNTAFAGETGADFPLLSDPTKATASAYGVLVSGVARRHTIYIGKDGTILKVDTRVRPASSAEDMAATLAELGVARR